MFYNGSNNPVLVMYGSGYSRMDQVKFVEDSLSKIRSDMVCLSRDMGYIAINAAAHLPPIFPA